MTPMAASFRSTTAALLRRHRGWLALGASPLLLGFAGLVAAAVLADVWLLPMVLTFFAIGGATLWGAIRNNRSPVALPAGIAVDEVGIHQGSRLVARRDELEAGFVTPGPEQTLVRLERRGLAPSIALSVADIEEGRALLRALGLDAEHTAAELRAASQTFTWSMRKQFLINSVPVLFVLVAQDLIAPTVWLRTLTTFAVVALILAVVFSPTRVRIGVDGVATRWLGMKRFIPFSKVRDVRRYEQRVGTKTHVGVMLVLDDGEEIKIPAGQTGWLRVEPAEIEERIREALELHRKSASVVDPRLLARGERSVGAWVASLRALGVGANADMRTPPIPADQLLRIAEDATASPLVRAGAAVAARVSPGARDRLRVAAETTASPALRIALERVASEDANDEALGEALGALDRAEAEVRR